MDKQNVTELSPSATLTRLLSRLDHTLLSSDADPKLRISQYERNRVAANLESARTLLLTAEKQSSTIRVQIQRQQIQADLQAKREQIKRLNGRLQELNQLDEVESSDEEEDEEGRDVEGGEDLLKEYAPARPDVSAGLDRGEPRGSRLHDEQQHELRARKPLQASDNRAAASTTAREQLFAGRKQNPDLETTENLMSHNRSEQEVLTNGLLGLAKALKESSLNFGSSLEAEKDVLKSAEGGLDKNAQGMESAERKMGTLRRMSEGQGWWGRIKLYAFIFALWVACFLLVFLGPKLRF